MIIKKIVYWCPGISPVCQVILLWCHRIPSAVLGLICSPFSVQSQFDCGTAVLVIVILLAFTHFFSRSLTET